MELHEGILYRMAYGLAADLAGARRWGMQAGRHRNNPAAGGDVEVILAEVVRQIRNEDPGETELVREAVDDAIVGRRPRW